MNLLTKRSNPCHFQMFSAGMIAKAQIPAALSILVSNLHLIRASSQKNMHADCQ